jgi:NAD(P)-dependent dehydrogenase (short-subunit alcohol dehydrogenase family)
MPHDTARRGRRGWVRSIKTDPSATGVRVHDFQERNNMKIALVTGGSRGLGRDMALSLAGKGSDVILTYNSKKAEADDVVAAIEGSGRKAAALPLDVASVASFPDFTTAIRDILKQKWDRDSFDFLVNNAGIGINTPFVGTTEEQFDLLMNVHLKGVFFLTQTLLPVIADGGRIVNISTGLTRFSVPGYSAYAAMKGAVEVLSRYLAKELGPRGITVNVVAPGAIETDFGGGHIRDNKELNSFIASQTALGRAGKPEDIGSVVASLLSDDNHWVNAQRIEASGGMFL